MAVLLVVGYGIYKIRPQVLLVGAAGITALVGWVLKLSWQEMQDGIVASIQKALPAILIMICVGMLIGSWIAAGTIPMIIFYGLKIISPKFFLVTACLVCSIASLATGTSWGTIGTLGVAFIGIAIAQGIPLGAAAGAIVAGAYFGDKLSPFSDVTNLAPVATGTNLFDHIKHMLWSAGPAWLIGLLIYFFIGLKYRVSSIESENISIILKTLQYSFHFNLILLLPIIIVFYFAFSKKPVIPGMILSALLASILAMIFQKESIQIVATSLNSGYPAHTGIAEVDRLLSRGGMMSMMETQLVAFTAFSFGGIMQKTGLLNVLLDRVMRFTNQIWSLVLTTISASVITALVTGSSYLAMIIPGELLAPVYKKKNLAAKNLSRIVEESGGIIVPLIPWSMAGVYITGTLGVSTFTYLPFTFMNYVSIIFLAGFGFTRFSMAPKIREDETIPGS
jgi:NhaC family Na+:H+ antiporter